MVEHPVGGSRIALFFSRIDAEMCRQYLNQQTYDGYRNQYECRLISDPAVQEILRGPINYNMACITGFATISTGRLVLSEKLYSLCQVLLHAGDAAWMRGLAPKPAQSFLESTQAYFQMKGAGSHLADCLAADSWDAKLVQQQAQLAIARIGFSATGDETGFAVYSPTRKAWSHLPGDF